MSSLHPEQFKAILPASHINELFDKSGNINMSDVAAHPMAQRMVQRHLGAVEEAHKRGLTAEAHNYYPHEQSIARSVGERFNDARAKQGKKLYLPDHPEQAGALIGGLLSQSNTESQRSRMVEHAASTGRIPNWISTPRIVHAMKHDIPAIDAAPPLKLRDYTGSILHPHEWSGAVIDRHMHNIASAKDWGEQDRGLAHAEKRASVRRYRFHQATVELARQAHDPKMPMPTFQSLAWHGERGRRGLM